jgi:alginate O-acetyltransferase complex protein AlgI
MVFSTPIFLFGFLPLFLVGYYLTPNRHRTLVLLIASCVFYGWWKLGYLLLVLGIASLSYVAGWGATSAAAPLLRLWWVRIGVAGNLAILAWFKYAYFIAGSYNDALARLGADSAGGITLPEIVLPIGLSFLVFQSISYILDVARGDAPRAARLIDFLAFSSLFPQLIAGPILRYKYLAHQFQHRTHSLALFTAGVRRFITGLAMKILIADSVAPLTDRMFALAHPTLAEAWLGAGAYAIQLFFDFAGYSAMAIGLGLMLGFRFAENFDAPYTSRSITEFWRRWHISLSTWLRDYLYVPLGGNREGAFKTYRNLVLTMVLGGLWHGANWTFLLWGVWHGGLMAVERALGAKTRRSVWPKAIAWPLTMVLVLIGWVMFRAETVGHAAQVYAGMVGANGLAITAEMALLTRPTEVICLALGAVLALRPLWAPFGPTMSAAFWPNLAVRSLALFALCAVIIQARGEAPFLYFQF